MRHWLLYAATLTLGYSTLFWCAGASAQRLLSDDGFAALKIDIELQLNTRYAAAEYSDELFPGATVALALPGGRVAKFAVGFADISKRSPMTSNSRMPSGSIGKTFVATLALSLAADGLLDLDSSISAWLADEPWFDRLPNQNSITVRQLLNHSSGLSDHVFDFESQFRAYFRRQIESGTASRSFEPQDLISFVLDREPLFAAGDGFHYSDTNYILLGLIIESASGSTYYEELTERFLDPLHLDHTSALDRRNIPGLAQGYAVEAQELFGLPPEVLAHGEFVFDPSIEWTGGGLVSSSQDLVRWAVALFCGEVLSPQSLKEMVNSIAISKPVSEHDSDQDIGVLGQRYGYGLGVNIAKTKHGIAYRHGGFFPGYNSLLAYYPEHGTAIAMQINSDRSNIEDHVEAIIDTVVDSVAGTPSPTSMAP